MLLESEGEDALKGWRRVLPFAAGVWIAPAWWLALALLPHTGPTVTLVSAIALSLAPLPSLLAAGRRHRRLSLRAAAAREQAEELKLQLDTVRYRTARLREELSAGDRQARLSHQLTLLGRFTAGFMHEFNNPLAIVASRLEVLLDERQEDAPLCADLQEMLKETRYMGNIACTLLQALRRERGAEVFAASSPAGAMAEALAALRPSAERQGVRLVEEMADVPCVDLPEHVVSEVTRGLLSNALDALRGRDGGAVWIRLEPYRSAGAKVVARIEDNGPGVSEAIRERLFEPFVTQAAGRERLGLGLFLAASLLDMYDARIRYETREGGGASFVLEMPPARFSRSQPFHWYTGGVSS